MTPLALAREQETPVLAKHSAWWQLALFCGGSVASGVLWILMMPVSPEAQQFFGISHTGVNSLSVVFLALYPPFTAVAAWTLDRYPLRVSVVVGNALTLAGAWLRVPGAATGSFAWVLVGQAIAACGQPFILGAPSLFSAAWFSEQQQGVATTVAVLANAVGVMLGFIIGPALVASAADIGTFIWQTSWMCTLLCVPPLLAFRSAPSDTSATVNATRSSSLTLRQEMKMMWQSRSFLVLCFVFSVLLSSFNILATLLDDILVPYGYTGAQTGTIGLVGVVLGVVSTAVLGPIIDRWPELQSIWQITMVAAAASAVLQALLLAPGRFSLLLVAMSLPAALMTTAIPQAVMLAVECSYPVSEATSGSVVMMLPQLASVPLAYIGDALPSAASKLWFLVALSVVAAALSLMFFRVPYLRRKHIAAVATGDDSQRCDSEALQLLPSRPSEAGTVAVAQ